MHGEPYCRIGRYYTALESGRQTAMAGQSARRQRLAGAIGSAVRAQVSGMEARDIVVRRAGHRGAVQCS